MKRFLAALSISLLGCQAQQPAASAPPEAQVPAPPQRSLPQDHVRLTSRGALLTSAGEPLSAAAIAATWREQAVHVHFEAGASYGALLGEVVGPAVGAEATALVLHSLEGERETRIEFAYSPAGVEVGYLILVLERAGLRLKSESFPDNEACLKALRTQRQSWIGSGALWVQLHVTPANEALPLETLQEAAALVVEAGCRPSLIAGHCAYAIERRRFERAMAAESLEERLRLLRAHLQAYPKQPRTSLGYLPFAWEWKGEIYVGNEWTEWTHVRTGETTKPKWESEKDD